MTKLITVKKRGLMIEFIKKYRLYILCCLSLFLSAASICFVIFKTKPIDLTNSTAIEWTVSALSLLVVILISGFGINYFTFERKISKMIRDKDNETRELVKELLKQHDKKMKVYIEERITHRLKYNKYSTLSTKSREYYYEGNYTQAFINALEVLSIFSLSHRGAVQIDLDEPSGIIMDFFNNTIAYGKVLYNQIKEKDYNNFNLDDVSRIRMLLNEIYTVNQIPKIFTELVGLMVSKSKDNAK